ncbi:MAG: hypothetical protein K9G02_01705 [Microbacteriaceae bacterium]|nr:hypothetical protein [Microbacteriaceae bacterium]
MNRRLLSASTLVGLALSVALVSPAHAVALDASGVDFNFANPGDLDRLTDVTTGDNLLYSNVATIDGNQIDALVTVGDVSDDVVSGWNYQKFTQAQIDHLNGLNPTEEDDLTVGCYTNAAYRADVEAGDYLYAQADFVASDRMADGYITAVDEYQGDRSDRGIHNDVDICNGEDPSAASSIEITVAFQTAGSPVTLDNLLLNVQDIDGGQSVMFSSPKPTSFELRSSSELVVTEDANFVRFFGEESSDDDPDFAAEVSYDGVTSFTYAFEFVENRSGGSLGVMFESYFDGLSEPLANTGTSDNAPGIVFFAGLVFVLAGVITARRLTRA